MNIIVRIYYHIIRNVNKFFFGKFGRGSVIIKPLWIINKKHIYVGDNVCIREQARIEAINSYNDMVLGGELIIGNGTTIEQHAHIITAKRVTIGKDCMLSARVFITDCSHRLYNMQKNIHNQGLVVNETIIGDSCFIGINSVILEGTRLGNHCIVGANSVVKGSFPEGCVIAGNPAIIIKQYNFQERKWKNT